MTSAHLRVNFAGPLISIQDNGRPGHMRYGVPASGPMDRTAFAAANQALHRELGSTCIEVSLGGLVLECLSGAITFAIAGGDFSVKLGDSSLAPWTVQILRAGDKLSLRGGETGSWTYIAFAGDISAERWLGKHATHSMSGFGGGMLTSGDEIEVVNASLMDNRIGDLQCPNFLQPASQVRVVIGPQEQHFEEWAIDTLLSTRYRVTDSFDRMGVKLDGPLLQLRDALGIPSEPILRGSVQVSGDGVPTVLLADHQTTGGYPKIATVLSCDVDALAQCRVDDTVGFIQISPEDAIVAAHDAAAERRLFLDEISKPRVNLAERLMRENLIGGVLGDW